MCQSFVGHSIQGRTTPFLMINCFLISSAFSLDADILKMLPNNLIKLICVFLFHNFKAKEKNQILNVFINCSNHNRRVCNLRDSASYADERTYTTTS